jgi:hypothetical protein
MTSKVQHIADFYYTPIPLRETRLRQCWLNMAKIEINIMDRQYTGGRIDSKETLESNAAIWFKERNKERRDMGWKFTRQEADKKLSKHYVS